MGKYRQPSAPLLSDVTTDATRVTSSIAKTSTSNQDVWNWIGIILAAATVALDIVEVCVL